MSSQTTASLNFSRKILTLQTVFTVGIGAMSLLLAIIGLLSGTKYLLFTVAIFGLGIATLGLAFGLWKLRTRFSIAHDKWRLLVLIVEAVFFGVGMVLIPFIPSTNEPTQGPFSDGGDGLFSLTIYAYLLGSILIIGLLLFEHIQCRSRKHT